jgi:hypothetical protein
VHLSTTVPEAVAKKYLKRSRPAMATASSRDKVWTLHPRKGYYEGKPGLKSTGEYPPLFGIAFADMFQAAFQCDSN